jgi:hypothetical protein
MVISPVNQAVGTDARLVTTVRELPYPIARLTARA